MFKLVVLIVICDTLLLVFGQFFGQPEQVHISYGTDPSHLVVTWSTKDPTNHSVVEYGVHGKAFSNSAYGHMTKFTHQGKLIRSQFIHRVTLKNLSPGASYVYHCGSPEAGWSNMFMFTAMKSGTNWSPRFAIFGDMGNENAQSVPRLQEDVAKGMYDAILHVGDFAYDLNTRSGEVGDEFLRQIEPLAAYVPYMTCPGNHENANNFSDYKNRFSMPGDEGGRNLFYSFNIGPVHLISFSTEFYFFLEYGKSQIENQYKWLEADLIEATSAESRALRPWIITMGHRPMYCSTNDSDDCSTSKSIIRLHLEPLFYKYGVDLEIWAHEHTYERLYPVYNETVYNGSYASPYTNPKAPVHIITGSAGCKERHDSFKKKIPEWSGFHSSDYGYSRMVVLNKTHLSLEQVSDDQGGAILDNFMLIKESHGRYS